MKDNTRSLIEAAILRHVSELPTPTPGVEHHLPQFGLDRRLECQVARELIQGGCISGKARNATVGTDCGSVMRLRELTGKGEARLYELTRTRQEFFRDYCIEHWPGILIALVGGTAVLFGEVIILWLMG